MNLDTLTIVVWVYRHRIQLNESNNDSEHRYWIQQTSFNLKLGYCSTIKNLHTVITSKNFQTFHSYFAIVLCNTLPAYTGWSLCLCLSQGVKVVLVPDSCRSSLKLLWSKRWPWRSRTGSNFPKIIVFDSHLIFPETAKFQIVSHNHP